MLLKCFIVVFVFQYVSQITYCQPSKKVFRKDYTYIEDSKSFYKIHTLYRTWHDAKDQCEMEGATLFYATDEDEATTVLNYWNKTQPFEWIFIGISTPVVTKVFETVDGIPIMDVYNKWIPGEPNNANYGVEGCVVLNKDGTMNDDNCNKKLPFICKKTLSSIEWNMFCDIPDIEYQYAQKLGKCYKFHTTLMKWPDAYAACISEQSRLAVINSQDEADFLANLTNNKPKDNVEGDLLSEAVHLGFHLKKNKWQTVIRNIPLSQSGYTEWSSGQPDGQGEEKCGSMFYDGQLSDTRCDQKLFFICEHEINLLRNDVIPRY